MPNGAAIIAQPFRRVGRVALIPMETHWITGRTYRLTSGNTGVESQCVIVLNHCGLGLLRLSSFSSRPRQRENRRRRMSPVACFVL
jgi:hypothetical protein